MKVTINLDIDKDDYAVITKWLKQYKPDNTVANTLEALCHGTVGRLANTAKAYFKRGGKSAMDEFIEEVKGV